MVENFIFRNETQIIFGKGTELAIGAKVAEYAKKILVHYGGGSIKASGLYDRVIASLKEANVEFVELSGVKPNPRVSLVREGIELCRREQVEFILAVGGGSVIDSAKAIAGGVNYEGDVWDLLTGTPVEHTCLPLATILTIPAAGSESSSGAVITNEDGNYKRSFGHPTLRPRFSILNPELTYTLPAYQTSCGLTDMFAHVVERYFTNTTCAELTDRLCESTMKTIVNQGRKVMETPNDYDVRAEIMLAGMVAHNDWVGIGRIGDWASHNLEHELSALYDIAHGAGLAIMIPAWMTYVYKHDVARFAQFANRVFDVEVNPFNLEETALKGIEETKRFFKDINMPVSFADASLPTCDIDEMSRKIAESYGTIGSFVTINEEHAKAIYHLAK